MAGDGRTAFTAWQIASAPAPPDGRAGMPSTVGFPVRIWTALGGPLGQHRAADSRISL